MDHEVRSTDPAREQACEAYARLRAVERARLTEWRDDLRLASNLVHDLKDDLMRFDQRYAPHANAAAHELQFRPERIREIDRKLRAPLRVVAKDVREARFEVVAAHEQEEWLKVLLWTAEPGFTVGTLPVSDLDRLGAVLFHMATAFWTWELFTLSRLRGDDRSSVRGRRRSAAARYMARWCDEHGEAPIRMARLLIALEVERPDCGDTGADPAQRLADTWRKK